VLGQFKRGKSTFLNALLGEPVLPVSVIPLTSVPTFVQKGTSRKARILFQDNREAKEFETPDALKLSEFLAGFVTETGNPRNHLRVSQVEVFHPSDILCDGVVFIDTPGIGSTLKHNTETTLNFLSQCDAALFLVSADPPITEVEIEFLKQVRAKVPRLFFLMNKVDYLTSEELEETLKFLRRVLNEQTGIGKDVRIFSISARKGLLARQSANVKMWQESGLAEIEEHFIQFLAREKTATLIDALSRKAADILAEVLSQLQLNIQSLQMPLQQLQGKLAVFDRELVEINRERTVIKDLLVGDQRRVHELLEEYSEQLRSRAHVYLEGAVREAIAGDNGDTLNEGSLQESLGNLISSFFEHEMGEATTFFDRKVSETLQHYQERANRLIESVRQTAAELFDIPSYTPEGKELFEIVREPYWITHNWEISIQPVFQRFVDRTLSANVRKRRILRRLSEQIESLIMQNVESLRWAVFQSIDHTFVYFGTTLDERLADTIAATHGAIKAALHKRQEHTESVAREISGLELAAEKIRTLETAIE
jgi:GTPase Era involved in 16S rRNA processing